MSKVCAASDHCVLSEGEGEDESDNECESDDGVETDDGVAKTPLAPPPVVAPDAAVVVKVRLLPSRKRVREAAAEPGPASALHNAHERMIVARDKARLATKELHAAERMHDALKAIARAQVVGKFRIGVVPSGDHQTVRNVVGEYHGFSWPYVEVTCTYVGVDSTWTLESINCGGTAEQSIGKAVRAWVADTSHDIRADDARQGVQAKNGHEAATLVVPVFVMENSAVLDKLSGGRPVSAA